MRSNVSIQKLWAQLEESHDQNEQMVEKRKYMILLTNKLDSNSEEILKLTIDYVHCSRQEVGNTGW